MTKYIIGKYDGYWFRITNELTRHQLIKYLSKFSRRHILNELSIMNPDKGIYLILKNNEIANYESIKRDVYRYIYKHYKPSRLNGKHLKRNGNGCIKAGLKLTCAINQSDKEFCDPYYKINKLTRFNHEIPERFYKRTRSWKKQYKCKKQYMIHLR